MKKKLALIFFSISTLLILSGCSKSSLNKPTPSEAKQEVSTNKTLNELSSIKSSFINDLDTSIRSLKKYEKNEDEIDPFLYVFQGIMNE